MAVVVTRPVVGTSATLIAQNTASAGADDTATLSFIVKNVTGSATIWLNGTNAVSSSNGLQWDPSDGPLGDLWLEPGEALWGIVASVPQTLHVLGSGR
jgi:hypothetical protein